MNIKNLKSGTERLEKNELARQFKTALEEALSEISTLQDLMIAAEVNNDINMSKLRQTYVMGDRMLADGVFLHQFADNKLAILLKDFLYSKQISDYPYDDFKFVDILEHLNVKEREKLSEPEWEELKKFGRDLYQVSTNGGIAGDISYREMESGELKLEDAWTARKKSFLRQKQLAQQAIRWLNRFLIAPEHKNTKTKFFARGKDNARR